MLRAGARGAGRGSPTPALVDRLYPRLLDLLCRGGRGRTRGSTTGRRRRSTGSRPAAGSSRSAPTSPSGWRCACSRSSGSRGRFAALLGADTLAVAASPTRGTCSRRSRASGGAPERAVLVGDTVTDRDTARAAGVPCVLVGFGPEGGGRSSALEPEAMRGALRRPAGRARAAGAARRRLRAAAEAAPPVSAGPALPGRRRAPAISSHAAGARRGAARGGRAARPGGPACGGAGRRPRRRPRRSPGRGRR